MSVIDAAAIVPSAFSGVSDATQSGRALPRGRIRAPDDRREQDLVPASD
jgi:hypothetical protein